ncbi:FmdB family zinc ribbon protein [Clostridium culturomicium]|uniref:hypothetical protein n=1 Tax=Clostridium culturomicium TaxID=1499683 RepID=UPI003857C8BE
MLDIYISYKCMECKREFILLTDEMISSVKNGKYVACPYCGNKKVKVQERTDDLREVAKARSYKRVNGRIREIL